MEADEGPSWILRSSRREAANRRSRSTSSSVSHTSYPWPVLSLRIRIVMTSCYKLPWRLKKWRPTSGVVSGSTALVAGHRLRLIRQVVANEFDLISSTYSANSPVSVCVLIARNPTSSKDVQSGLQDAASKSRNTIRRLIPLDSEVSRFPRYRLRPFHPRGA